MTAGERIIQRIKDITKMHRFIDEVSDVVVYGNIDALEEKHTDLIDGFHDLNMNIPEHFDLYHEAIKSLEDRMCELVRKEA